MSWHPIYAGWTDYQLEVVRELQQGFDEARVQTRLDQLGEPPFQVSMLRVRCPVRALEAAENWLLHLVQPLDDQGLDWAGNVICLLHQRWPAFQVWKGTPRQWRSLERLLQFGDPSTVAFAGSRYMSGHSHEEVNIDVFQRSAVEVLARVPGVEIHPDRDIDDPHHWVAIEVAAPDSADLQSLQDALRAGGIATCRCEVRCSVRPRTVLTIHAGDDDLEQLRQRVTAVVDALERPLRRPAACWIAMPKVAVHRCKSVDALSLRARIEGELDGLWPDCSWYPDSGVIYTDLHQVDRVLDWLRAHPSAG